ncbi:hypothetical protein ACFE04_024694 [Oxalis oulophora]
MTSQSGGGDYDISKLFEAAQSRWLKPGEVYFILQNHDKFQLTEEPPHLPNSGSLFLFNKRVLRFFRRDGHNWRKKRDGRTVGEAHERLKVGNVEALNCYYAHGEHENHFQRRCYWMLHPGYDHIVLVHYRDVSEARPIPGSITHHSPGSSSMQTPSPSFHSAQNAGSTSLISDIREPYQNLSSPEVSSDVLPNINNNADVDVNQTLKRLEEQLSLNDDNLEEIRNGDFIDSEFFDFEEIFEQDKPTASTRGHTQQQSHSTNIEQLSDADRNNFNQLCVHDYTNGSNSLSWDDMLDSKSKPSSTIEFQGKPQSFNAPENSQWANGNNSSVGHSSMFLPQEDDVKLPAYLSGLGPQETNSEYYTTLFDQVQNGIPLEADSRLTVTQKQKFTIREISPEWGYASESTKIIIIGSFLCDPLEATWTCMFNDTEVPLHLIQEGVMQCEAPPCFPGKVTLCITSANREACSEVREFEYRAKDSNPANFRTTQVEPLRSTDELLLLVRFVQVLSDLSTPSKNGLEFEIPRSVKANDDTWSHMIESLLVGGGTSSGAVDWILQELLKDKLQQWLSSLSQDDTGCSLSKKDRGIIHMVAGLGYEWALNPILSHGVGVNFRDINGWTALHWAARFGREKMVAALMASGASAGALTDPSTNDRTGKTAASIADSSGHKGLAGYLSEVALTSHLDSLTLEESELHKSLAQVEAEKTVNSVSNKNLGNGDDQVSLKDTLAAVRNAAQAAARIQAAFRAHSFRRRRQRVGTDSEDEYGLNPDDMKALAALSKLRNARDYNSAAVSIQKKYRGYKGRKDFLAFRQKVVKIQAHVRGYQVRKNYTVGWAVGILEKVILRWRRKGVGLRGFQQETELIAETEDEEDVLKVFRRKKVETSIDEAVSRVLSMVESPNARKQYHRMLEKYRQAKAQLGGTSQSTSSSPSPSPSSASVPVGYDINSMFEEAQSRWLRPAEVFFILRIDSSTAKQRVLRFFRRDGHNWCRNRDGRTVAEQHERLEVLHSHQDRLLFRLQGRELILLKTQEARSTSLTSGGGFTNTSELDVNQALRSLEEQF